MRGLCRLLLSAWTSWLAATACGAIETEPGRVCAWHGRRASGPCASLCTWQCGVSSDENVGCERGGCRERCILDRLAWTDECLNKAHAEWVCILEAGLDATCATGEPVRFRAEESACAAEHAEAEAACETLEPLALPPVKSLCEWQCEVVPAIGCETTGCLEACRARDASLSEACRAAALEQWICLAESGRSVTCCEQRIRSAAGPGACAEEIAAATAACGDTDPLTIELPDLSPTAPAGDAGDAGDAAASDADASTLPAELGRRWRASCDEPDGAAGAAP